jgi:predicted ATPase
LEKALAGERQLVFITGEPGRGKTTLVDGFLDQVARDGKIWMGRGLCIEHYGAGEAYRPIFDAITQLCHAPGRRNLIELLGQYAPTWLVQMPALLDGQEFAALKRKTQGTTPERMLREVTEALETLTAAQPLILVLEDLHWSDGSTLDLLAFLARRRQSARLLVLGTYRPAEMIANDHPLKAVRRELLGQERCQDLPLLPFSEHEVNEYLVQRFMKHTYSKRRERSQMELW